MNREVVNEKTTATYSLSKSTLTMIQRVAWVEQLSMSAFVEKAIAAYVTATYGADPRAGLAEAAAAVMLMPAESEQIGQWAAPKGEAAGAA
jgi:predicted transcriptional regulator